jgi:hypothetical protein
MVLDYPAFLSFLSVCLSETALDHTMTGPATSTRAVSIAIGKALITILAVSIIVWQVDFAFLFSHLDKLSAFTLITSLILLASQTSLIAGLRLKFVLEALGRNLRLSETVQVALSGFFSSRWRSDSSAATPCGFGCCIARTCRCERRCKRS